MLLSLSQAVIVFPFILPLINCNDFLQHRARHGGGGGGGGGGGDGGSGEDVGGLDPLLDLQAVIPGVPGEDYPIYSEVPQLAFSCEGRVERGYYADVEAECQVFHICGNDGNGGLTKYSFLCPNGTIFQQQYFVCDWWFNVDCPVSENFYSLNEDVAAASQAVDQAAGRSGSGGTGAVGGAVRDNGGAGGEGDGDGVGGVDDGYDLEDAEEMPDSTGGGQRGRNRLAGGGRRRGGASASGHRYLSPSLPPPEDYEDSEDLAGYGAGDLGRYTG